MIFKKMLNISAYTMLMIIVLCGCSDDNEVQTSFEYECYMDSVETVAIEDILHAELPPSAVVALSNSDVVEARFDKYDTKKHLLDLKRTGRVTVMVNNGGRMYSISLVVNTVLINWRYFWRVYLVNENIICSSAIRQDVIDDFHANSIVPTTMELYDMLSVDYDLNSFGTSASPDIPLRITYDRTTDEYVVEKWYHPDGEQRFKFSVITIRDGYGKMRAELKCDMTEYYQAKYGKDNVRQVQIVYKMHNDRITI